MGYKDIEELKGKTFSKVYHEGYGTRTEIFFENETEKYVMRHDQDCCESVHLEDLNGELSWLENTPILVAEERSNEEDPGRRSEYDDSYTWTFYTLRTAKGTVDLRWYGTSNGYYSESVDVYLVQ